MSVGERKGNIYVDAFDIFENRPDDWTPFAEYRIPASEWYLLRNDKPCNLYIPFVEEIEHGGDGEETLELSHRIVDSAGLTDDQSVYVEKGELVSVDYENDKITVDHDTDEKIKVYYLGGNGQLQVNYIPPMAQGSARKTLLDKSLLNIHARNQYDKKSHLFLERVGLTPEKHKIQLWVNTPGTVGFPDNFEIGEITIPYKARPRTDIPEGTEQEIISELTNA